MPRAVRAPPSPDLALSGDRPVTQAPLGGAHADLDESETAGEEPAQSDEELAPSASDRSSSER